MGDDKKYSDWLDFEKNYRIVKIKHEVAIKNREYFRLQIEPEVIKIFAGSDCAVDWAIDVLWQMIAQEKNNCIPCCTIEDWPDLPVRGFMLDISRGRVPMLNELHEIIYFLHRCRYNQLQLYTEHTYRFKDHPAVWKGASAFKPEDLEIIQNYCNYFHIELVPNLNSFGHVERWVEAR